MARFILITTLLTGCGSMQRSCTGFTGNLTYKCSKVNTEYVQSDSGIALLVDKHGNPVECE